MFLERELEVVVQGLAAGIQQTRDVLQFQALRGVVQEVLLCLFQPLQRLKERTDVMLRRSRVNQFAHFLRRFVVRQYVVERDQR